MLTIKILWAKVDQGFAARSTDLQVPPAPRLPPSLKLWRDKLEDKVFFDIATTWRVTVRAGRAYGVNHRAGRGECLEPSHFAMPAGTNLVLGIAISDFGSPTCA
jgi:hypothetical protein